MISSRPSSISPERQRGDVGVARERAERAGEAEARADVAEVVAAAASASIVEIDGPWIAVSMASTPAPITKRPT